MLIVRAIICLLLFGRRFNVSFICFNIRRYVRTYKELQLPATKFKS